MLERRAPVLAPEARHLHAAERQLDGRDVVVIDPARARLQLRDHPMAARQIVGEHARRQPEFAGVGALDDFALVGEFQHRHDGPENLLAHDRHVVAALIEHGWRDEISLAQLSRGHAPAAGQKARALGAAAGDVAEHLVHVLLRYQRADLRRRIHRIADAHRAHAPDQAIEERRLHRRVHEHARRVRAHLAGGIEIREQRAGHCVVQLGVFENDQRRLAAELERHALQRLRRVAHHRLARADLAGQRHLANAGMAGEQTAGIGKALHHLEHARRQSGLAAGSPRASRR